MAATHPHDHDDLLGNDLPPPAYELTDSEFDRKIADATQRSLSLQQEQLQRPALPPLDEDGFPLWSEELFKFNEAQRQREDESRSAKLRSEYTYTGTQLSGSSGSASSPPSRASVGAGLNSKQGNKWWFDSSTQVIAQDEDEDEGHGRLNVGRLPSMLPQTQNLGPRPPPIQVQIGPRPHDILAQPQSPTSDVDEDEILTAGDSSLGRAPTYYPMGQTHPGHAQRLERHSTRGSESSIRTMLPAFTPEAESLEGPAYEEVEQIPRSVPQERRQSAEWRPMNARPQAQERVSRASMVPYGAASPPPRPPPTSASIPPPAPAPVRAPPLVSAPLHRPTAPSAYTPPALPATTPYVPTGYNPPVVAPRPTTFDPTIAYHHTETYRYTLAGRVGADDGILEAQRALREGGASAFYNTAVAGTMQKSPAFHAPAPPPLRVADDAASVFSGRSVGSGGARMSVYAPNDPTPNRMSYVPPLQTSGPPYRPMGGQTYQPAPAPAPAPAPMPAHAPGAFNPPPPPGVYQATNAPLSRPLPTAPGFAQPNMGGHMHPPPNGFVVPPPPPGAGTQPGKKPGKLYKRL
ncbi:hypothetical protein FRC11_013119 [Ceratobasidium sp. 423]|nr:hypothetical protein FRC11_013119 [Ceratobasidium sp. 423]